MVIFFLFQPDHFVRLLFYNPKTIKTIFRLFDRIGEQGHNRFPENLNLSRDRVHGRTSYTITMEGN